MDFYFLLKNTGKSIGKNISKKLAGKYRQKSSFLTASIKAIRKTAEVNDDLVVNKFANEITEISKKFTTKKSRGSYK